MIEHRNKYWWRPLFRLDIEIPFIRIATNLMGERVESMIIEYLMLYVQIYKWHFEFRLYNTSERMVADK